MINQLKPSIMNRKQLYDLPESKSIILRNEASYCASYTGPQTTYGGQVNNFSDIDEVDISNLWD